MKLCDTCKNNRHRLTPTTCACVTLGETPMRPMPEEGEAPTKVCGPYEPRKDEDGEEA